MSDPITAATPNLSWLLNTPDAASAEAQGAETSPGPASGAAAAATYARAIGATPAPGGGSVGGNKYTGGAESAAGLGPPPLSAAAPTARTLQLHDAFAATTGAGLQAAVDRAAADPRGATRVPLTSASAQTPAAALAQAGKWGSNALPSFLSAQDSSLRSFLLLRVKNGQEGFSALQAMGDLMAKNQDALLSQELARGAEAEKASKKAAQKASGLGFLGKIINVVMAIVTVVVTVATMGSGAALGVLATALVAGLIAGGVKGAKSGKGFDLFGGLEVFSIAGSALSGMALVKGMLMSATKFSMQAAERVMGKSLENVVKSAARQAATRAAQQGGGKAATAAAGAAVDEGGQAAGNTLAKLLQASLKKVASGAPQRFAGAAGNKALVYGQVAVATAQGTGEVAKGAVQLQVTQAQLDAKEHLAVVDMLKATVDRINTGYSSVQDVTQSLYESHNKAVQAANRIIRGKNQVSNIISGNMA